MKEDRVISYFQYASWRIRLVGRTDFVLAFTKM